MTTIPTKVGLTLLGVYWAVMAGMTIHHLSPPETLNLALGTDRASMPLPPLYGGTRIRRTG